MSETFLDIHERIDYSRIKDHPNILIAAGFWDEDRYLAAKTCYKYMRAIDDLIDCHKATHTEIAEGERDLFMTQVQQWLRQATHSGEVLPGYDDLAETIRRFLIPLWPMEDFARSMIYDIGHKGFQTLQDFLAYSKGASVAPASIFVHLSGLAGTKDNYELPRFDVREAATPCAIFSYLVHIIRDFQKDQLQNLNYFADDILEKNGLCAADLGPIARGAGIPPGFRKVISEYHALADIYREQTLSMIRHIWPYLGPRYRLSLQIIFNLYLMVFERIDPEKGSFVAAELNPTSAEARSRVQQTILCFSDEP